MSFTVTAQSPFNPSQMRQISIEEAAKEAVNVLEKTGTLRLSFGELTCKLYFTDLNHISYATDCRIVEQIKINFFRIQNLF